MRLVSGFAPAALIAALLLATPTVVAAEALPAAVGKPLEAARKAATAGNIGAATASINQARSAANSPNERRKVAEMAAFVYTRGGQFGKAAAELESIGAPASQLAPLYYQARDYSKAIEAGRRSGQMTIVGQSLLQLGRAKEAVGVYQQLVRSNPNNIGFLTNLAGAQAKSGDKAGYIATTTRIVRLDPSPASWRRLLVDMKGSNLPREGKLGLYHLMLATDTLTNADDIQEFAKTAIVAGQAGVAADVAKKLPATDPMGPRLAQAAAQRAAPALAAAPAQARNPATAMQAGGAFLGAGQYPAAIAAFNTAKTGPDPAAAQLFVGIAQVRAGQAAAARTTFNGVPAGQLKDLANLWALYASTK
ncbi:tetratricopeptide repeat protein [Sandaracinobacteroides saxicola]|uniref:Tetratricopeptide repeat protein n=1 Tax=Sandaracinobacteroides saxicola TaxID=2759707 RepID=A0A7G5IG71_9SPHN|nr:tetratricopeptide repeat protein [Sandaracinobacteroides saxicola]QMW22363.1 hypothetical protein H3309_13560 [Sandaracinobacteroides saxicola]